MKSISSPGHTNWRSQSRCRKNSLVFLLLKLHDVPHILVKYTSKSFYDFIRLALSMVHSKTLFYLVTSNIFFLCSFHFWRQFVCEAACASRDAAKQLWTCEIMSVQPALNTPQTPPCGLLPLPKLPSSSHLHQWNQTRHFHSFLSLGSQCSFVSLED